MQLQASMAGQPSAVLPFLLLGVLLGAFYDIFRIARLARRGGHHIANGRATKRLLQIARCRVCPPRARRAKKHTGLLGGALIFCEDLLFALPAGALFLILQFAYNSGMFRWYLAAVTLCGFFCYYLTIGRLVIRVAGFLTALLRYLLLYLYNHTVYYLLRFLRRALCFVGHRVKKLLSALQKAHRKKQSKRWCAHLECVYAGCFYKQEVKQKGRDFHAEKGKKIKIRRGRAG